MLIYMLDKVYLKRVLTKNLKQAEIEKKKTCDSNREKIIDAYIDILKQIEIELNQL